MNKLQQRKLIKERIDYSKIKQYSNSINEKVLQFIKDHNISTIMSYKPLNSEVDVNDLNQKLVELNKTVCFPKILEDYKMVAIKSDSFSKNIYNILEPTNGEVVDKKNIDLIIVPLVGYDLNFNRLGHSKGYYDRYLSNYKGIKLAVAFKWQEVEEIETNAFDIKMDYIINEEGIYERRNEIINETIR